MDSTKGKDNFSVLWIQEAYSALLLVILTEKKNHPTQLISLKNKEQGLSDDLSMVAQLNMSKLMQEPNPRILILYNDLGHRT